MKDAELIKIVRGFRNGLLGGRDSTSMCFAVCFPLQGYLQACGVESKIMEVDFGHSNHIWLLLRCGRILDPTADQFSTPESPLPDVYLGDVPEIYQQWMESAKKVKEQAK